MRVIFLDIDGVCNNVLTYFINNFRVPYMGRYTREEFDQTTLAVIRKSAELLDAKFVLASTWAYGASEQELMKLGACMGLTFIGKVDDDLKTERPTMISKYLKENPEITEYAIIDDEVSWYKDTVHSDKYIEVDIEKGITYPNIIQLGNIFKVNLLDLSADNRKDKKQPTETFMGSSLLGDIA